MDHGNFSLGGPLYWVIIVMLFGAGMLAAFVTLDSIRRLLKPGASRRLWAYLVPQALFFVLLIVSQWPKMPILVNGILVLCSPFALGDAFAYLLRVVYPKPAAVAAPVAAQSASAAVPAEALLEPGPPPQDDPA